MPSISEWSNVLLLLQQKNNEPEKNFCTNLPFMFRNEGNEENKEVDNLLWISKDLLTPYTPVLEDIKKFGEPLDDLADEVLNFKTRAMENLTRLVKNFSSMAFLFSARLAENKMGNER